MGVTLAVALGGLLLGLAFAGSPSKLPAGVRIAGVPVGGLTPGAARTKLERRAARFERVPVSLTAVGHVWRLRPAQLGLKVDWAAAVRDARRQGNGLGPFRGLRRLEVRVFGADITPPVQVYEAGLDYQLDRFAHAVDSRHREASLELRGLHVAVVGGRTGRVLNRSAAARVIVHALASLVRAPVALPVRVDSPRLTAADLGPAAARTRTALSAPITLQLGPTQWLIPRWRIAKLLELPQGGRSDLRIGGREADRWVGRLARRIDRAPVDADWAVGSAGVRVVPARPGLVLNVPDTAAALLRAATAAAPQRLAHVVVSTKPAERTTAEARAMGITGAVGTYETFYGGEPNRIHNVQLVAHLVDRKLIAPGATFSFNGATGERTAAKGFLEAPVIINGELQTGLGGGVCQVSTTVFNAAYEAGLPITARTNHALYISHYPTGRDATVNYPDTDLKFVNDTKHWLLLRTFVGSSSLVVGLYGTPTGRRVVTDTAPLVVTGQPAVKRVPDPTLEKGETVVEDYGEPSRATSVRRRVYAPSGRLLSDNRWYSSYRSEPKLVRYGTKPKAKGKPKPSKTETTTTGTTTATKTTPTATTSTPPDRPLP